MLQFRSPAHGRSLSSHTVTSPLFSPLERILQLRLFACPLMAILAADVLLFMTIPSSSRECEHAFHG